MTAHALLDEQLRPTYDASECLRRGRELADHGMRLVEAASTEAQRAAIDHVIDEWARSGRCFSLNDLRVEFPHTRPALRGARVMHAAKAGRIRDTGETVPSTLPSTRGHRLVVWTGAS